MKPEHAIILAFWQPKQQRFVELTADELQARSGQPVTEGLTASMIYTGIITAEEIAGPITIYGLTYRGKQTAKHILQTMKLKPARRLTAIPPEMRK